MKTRPELIGELKTLAAEGAAREPLVAWLRTAGCSKADSVAVLRQALDISLREAHELVHLSDTWRDVRDRDDKLMEMLDDVLRENGFASAGSGMPRTRRNCHLILAPPPPANPAARVARQRRPRARRARPPHLA